VTTETSVNHYVAGRRCRNVQYLALLDLGGRSVGNITHCSDDQQVVRQHKSARIPQTIHNPPYDEQSADDQDCPGRYEDFETMVRPVL
jgi:hypothetical protein